MAVSVQKSNFIARTNNIEIMKTTRLQSATSYSLDRYAIP